MSDLRVLIAIPTFRRAGLLLKLLEEIKAQIREMPPDVRITVRVLDNDADPRVEALVDQSGGPVRYVDVQERGIGHVRNRAFQCAETFDWIVFFDDDQRPVPKWLEALSRAMRKYPSAVLSGPVLPVMPLDAPSWAEGAWAWGAGRDRFADGQEKKVSGFGNVAIPAAVFALPDCRVAEAFLNRPGEDTDLFLRLTASGVVIRHVAAALAHEAVPAERVTKEWVVARARADGETWGIVQRNRGVRGAATVGITVARRLFTGVIWGFVGRIRGIEKPQVMARADRALARGAASVFVSRVSRPHRRTTGG